MSETTQRWSLDDLQQQVVAACLYDTSILEHVSARYKLRFTGSKLGAIIEAAIAYFEVTRQLLSRDAFRQILINNTADSEKHAEYLAIFDSLTEPPYSTYDEGARRWFLHSFDKEWQIQFTGNALAEAAERMRGDSDPDIAWTVLNEQRIQFVNMQAGGALHEADITEITEKIKLHYHEVVENKYPGVELYLPEVNEAIGSLKPGDMMIYTGFAQEGKSFFLLNDSHHAWTLGHNISFANGEMGGFKFPNRFVAKHSHYMFSQGLITQPLETKRVDRGLLTIEEHEIFLKVLADIKSRGDGKYGRFFHFTFGFNSTPSSLFNRFAAYDQIAPLYLTCIDYLGLLDSESKRVTRRESLDEVIRQSKQLALDFRKGSGIPLLTGYQTNRSSYEKALNDGYYTLTAFAESSEAEKSADSAMYILNLRQNPNEVKCGFIKNRDDELGEPFFVQRNFKYGTLESLQRSASSISRVPEAAPGSSLLDI